MGGYRPIFKRPEDEISKKVEDKVRIGIDSKIRTEVDEKIKARVEGVKSEVNTRVEERFKEESEKVRGEVDSRVKTEVEARVLAILKEKEDKDKSDKANKIAKAVDVAKALKGESDSDKVEKERADKEKIAAEKEKNDILCPTCHTEGRSGHIHRAETDKSGFVYKCNDKGCGYEAVLVPKNSDYKCKNCSMPIKKPTKEELVKDMDCPFCHNKSAIKFDWSKIWNVLKK